MIKIFLSLGFVFIFFGISLAHSFSGVSIKNLYHCVVEVPSYFWHTTQDDLGNTYMGLYSQGDGTERCAYIFKIDTDSKLSVVYYDNARHIHTVAFNPITKKLYASQGDDIPWLAETRWQSKFIVSDDYGLTWKTLQHFPRANYIPIIFDKHGCVIVWEDSAQYSPSSRLMKSCDDKRFSVLLTLSGDEQANWWSWYQSGTEIYIGTVVDQAWFVPTVWKSADDGRTRERIMRIDMQTEQWDGFHSMWPDNRWIVRFRFGNARKQTSAFSSLIHM
jgi:hypothetical protein